MARPLTGLTRRNLVRELMAGVSLLFLAARQWRSRQKPGEDAALPKWMAAIDQMTAGRSFVLDFLLSAVSSKDLLMDIGSF